MWKLLFERLEVRIDPPVKDYENLTDFWNTSSINLDLFIANCDEDCSQLK
jgi:hypothetical protein